MTETISQAIAPLLDAIVPSFENEAGTQRMPYAVFTLETEPTYIKGGTSKIAGTLMVYVYASSGEHAAEIADSVKSTIAANLGGKYRSKLRSATSDNDDGSYMQTLEYYIAQIA